MEHRGHRPGVIFLVNFCFVYFHQLYTGDNYKDEIEEVVENIGHRPIVLNGILFYILNVIFLVQWKLINEKPDKNWQTNYFCNFDEFPY